MPPKKQASYGQKNTSNMVFKLAKPVAGKPSTEYRKDPYNNIMKKSEYGKSSKMGWDVDHIKPSSRGGSNNIRNLQALNSSVNRSKGNSLQKKSRHSK
jgi:5-methylcytosine-specific restriction endonuclease McrA